MSSTDLRPLVVRINLSCDAGKGGRFQAEPGKAKLFSIFKNMLILERFQLLSLAPSSILAVQVLGPN